MRNQPFSEHLTQSATDAAGDPRRRLRWLTAMFWGALAIIAVRMGHMQAHVAPRYVHPWLAQTVEVEPIPARDGRILTRDGVILAQNQTRYDIAVQYRWLETPSDPAWLRQMVAQKLTKAERKNPALRHAAEQEILAQRAQLLRDLAELTGDSPEQMSLAAATIQAQVEKIVEAVEGRRREREAEPAAIHTRDLANVQNWMRWLMDELTTSPDRARRDPVIVKEELQDHVLLTNVSLDVVGRVQSQPARFPGVAVRSVTARDYPQNDLAANLVGVRRWRIPTEGGTPREHAENGLELAYDAQLRGVSGEARVERSHRGVEVARQIERGPRDGSDLALTIDSRLQKIAEDLLDESAPVARGGCLVAMDLWTGELLALAASPRASLTVLQRPTRMEWDTLTNDPRQPLFSRELRMALPPGDLFKLVTAAAALNQQVAGLDSLYDCRGYLTNPQEYRCPVFQLTGRGHGAVTIPEAWAESCQTCFFDLAQRLPPAALSHWGARFGFGHGTGVGLLQENSGKLPDLAQVELKAARRAALQVSIGQGELLVTPLQIARMIAAIANGGTLVTPQVVTDFEQLRRRKTLTTAAIASPDIIHALRLMLLTSASHSESLTQYAEIEGLAQAAQACVARGGLDVQHGWYAGYAPVERPRIALVVALERTEDPTRAPLIAREFLMEMLGLGELRPPGEEQLDSFSPGQSIDPLARSGETAQRR